MAGERFDKASLRDKLQFESTTLISWINSPYCITADYQDEVNSGAGNGGIPRLHSYYYPNPTEPASPVIGTPGAYGYADATKSWILALARMYVIVRTYTLVKTGGGGSSKDVKAVPPSGIPINQITSLSQLAPYININIATGSYIADGNITVQADAWKNLILYWSTINEGTFSYCHQPPACHGSRGRR